MSKERLLEGAILELCEVCDYLNEFGVMEAAPRTAVRHRINALRDMISKSNVMPWWADIERSTSIIEGAERGEGGVTVRFDGAKNFFLPAGKMPPVFWPITGRVLTLWGKGFGYPVRGVAIDDTLLWWEPGKDE